MSWLLFFNVIHAVVYCHYWFVFNILRIVWVTGELIVVIGCTVICKLVDKLFD